MSSPASYTIKRSKTVRDVVEWDGLTATLFGKFYEEVLRGWFRSKGYHVYEGKPRIYWKQQPIAKVITDNHKIMVDELIRLQREASYVTPDGLLVIDGRRFVWEAKNWIQELGPAPLSRRIWQWAWLLSKSVNYKGQDMQIHGFVISWWKKEADHDSLLSELRQCISPLAIDIIYTRQILEECISNRPPWYVDIIKTRRSRVNLFFDQLLGNDSILTNN